MKGIRIAFLVLFFGSCSATQAASNLGWVNTSFSKDTLFLGDTLYITTALKNFDTQAFHDTVRISIKINGVVNVNPNIFPNPFPVQPMNIPAGDSIPTTMAVVITPAYFLVGPDILVVWPRANDGSPAHDSIIKTITVLDPTTGIGNEKNEQLKLFYSDQHIYILSRDLEINLNRVRIFSLQGQEILTAPLADNNSIPFKDQPNGIYFAEVKFNSTERRIFRISKY